MNVAAHLHEVLARMTPEELQSIFPAVRLFVEAGTMTESEANRWRHAIAAWVQFRNEDPATIH